MRQAFKLVQTAIDLGVYNQNVSSIAEENLATIRDKRQQMNALLLMYVLSVANDLSGTFQYCVHKIGQNIGPYPKDFAEARRRTCMTMRQLLEFALVAAVCVHNVEQVKKILVYGRENTFLLSVTDNLLQIALRLTEDDGPLRGDFDILRVLITNATVVKPIASPRR